MLDAVVRWSPDAAHRTTHRSVLGGGGPGSGVEVAFDAGDPLDWESALNEIADDIAAAWWTSGRA